MTKGKFIITIVLSILLIGCCLILRTFDKTTYYEKQVTKNSTQYKTFTLTNAEIETSKDIISKSKIALENLDFVSALKNTNLYDETSHYYSVMMDMVSKYNFKNFDEAIMDFSQSMKDVMQKKKISFTDYVLKYDSNNNFFANLKLYFGKVGTDEKANLSIIKLDTSLKINIDSFDLVTPLSVSNSGLSFQFLIDYWEKTYLSSR